jgi:hypothetical protein
MKQVSCRIPKNISNHHTKFSHNGDWGLVTPRLVFHSLFELLVTKNQGSPTWSVYVLN